MRKLLKVFLLIVSLFMMQAHSQTNVVQIMEGEVRAGMTTPLGGYRDGEAQMGAALGIEGRYNFKGTPWDCGLMLDLSVARRGYEHLFNDGYDRWQSNRTLALAFTGDYNLRQGAKINPFVGTGLGVAFNDVVGDKYFPTKGTAMFFSPRVGVEFLSHIRLMAQFNISRKGYNNFCLSVGFVLGGRAKK